MNKSNITTLHRRINKADSIREALKTNPDLLDKYIVSNPLEKALKQPKLQSVISANSVEKIVQFFDFSKYKPLLFITPYIDYSVQLSCISTHYKSLVERIEKVNKPIKQISEIGKIYARLEEAKEEAENNLWHKLIMDEYNTERVESELKITELNTKIVKMEKAISSYKYIILSGLNEQKQPQAKVKNLLPNITTSQITRLYNGLKGIFTATPEQWKSLFSETEIQLSTPIEARAVSDVGILLHYLKEMRLIGYSNYPSVIERTKAFVVGEMQITAKKITDLKSNYNFPTIGKNYSSISRIIQSL